MKRTYMMLILLFAILSGCKKEPDKTVKSIVVLGNSITIHAPDTRIGWYGNWGMAATTGENDYVHILARLASASVVPINISAWENDPTQFNFTILEPFLNTKPDIVLIRLGENVHNLEIFDAQIQKLINTVKTTSPQSRIIITGTFWANEPVSTILRSYAERHALPYISLSHLDKIENVSYLGASTKGEDGMICPVTNASVAAHPGDKGMNEIAQTIYQNLLRLKIL